MTLAESDAYFADRSKPEMTKYITEQVFRELDVFLDHYPIVPKQCISYQREAFFGKDNHDFRLTFDRKITERRFDLGEHKLRNYIRAQTRLWRPRYGCHAGLAGKKLSG